MTCPDPGIYTVPFAEYCGWDAMNISTLVEGMASMRRLRAKLDGRLESADSSALRFGRAVHCRLLEPDLFCTSFPTAEKCCATLKPKRKADPPQQCKSFGRYIGPEGWYCGTHAGDDVFVPTDFVMPEELERIERIRESAFGHKEIAAIRQFGGAEQSVVFDLLGVRCKARLDKWIPENGGYIVDVKTTSKPLTDSQWQRTMVDLNYHVKAAFYIEAVKSLGCEAPEFVWVVVETAEPFDVAAIRLDDEARRVGRFEALQLLSRYAACLDSGVWPGAYPELVTWIGLPPWELKKYEGQEIG